MFNNGLSGEKKPKFGASADFHGTNTPATADFRLSRDVTDWGFARDVQ